jgi:hypothetical protein
LTESPPTLALTTSLPEVELPGKASLKLALANSGEEPAAVRVRWHLPRELAVQPLTRELALAPGEDRRERFRLATQGALAGSSYGIYAILEWDGPHGPAAALVPGRVVVTEPHSSRLRLILGGVLALLLAAWLGAQWGGRSRR